MSYEVRVQPAADRGLARCPSRVRSAIIEFLFGALAERPHRVGKSLGFELDGLHSARRGDYRILYRVDDGDKTVSVVRIDHRAHVYRPR